MDILSKRFSSDCKPDTSASVIPRGYEDVMMEFVPPRVASLGARAGFTPTSRLFPLRLCRFEHRSGVKSRPHLEQCRRYAGFAQASHTAPDEVAAEWPSRLPPTSGFTRLRHKCHISVAGLDAPKFLQGLITNNVYADGSASTPRKDGFYTAFLSAHGRVLYDAFIYPDTSRLGAVASDSSVSPGEAFVIETDEENASELIKLIKRHKLRSKFKYERLADGQYTTWQIWDGWEDAGNSNLIPAQEGTLVIRDTRAPGMGYRVLRKGTDAPTVEANETDADAFLVRRFLQGVPEGSHEVIQDKALPMECNMDLMGAIDFHKGCYVGQELTIRTKHRGVVRKRILPVMISPPGTTPPPELRLDLPGSEPEDVPPEGLSIEREGSKGRSPGTLLRAWGNIGLASCQLQSMTDIQLPGEESSKFNPEQKFGIRWTVAGKDKELYRNVKAFPPDWLRQKLAEESRNSSPPGQR